MTEPQRDGVVLDDRGDKKVPYAFASLRSLTTSAKTIHRTVFFRRQVCSLLVRIPLFVLPKQKAGLTTCFPLWRRVRDFFGILPYAFASLCSLTTSAKTVHRTVFFRRQVCSLLVRIPNKKEKQCQSITSLFGGELGIFRHTAVCLRVALLLDHVGENSPPDCFLPQTSLLPPCSNPKQKKRSNAKASLLFLAES